ncbi:hypothetical protein CbuK_0776 [Coxiella burnetii CbuK_Q154]|nr:hypothetical protein CbuK_0776 [Coxiella burnetii CbuK_Q154]
MLLLSIIQWFRGAIESVGFQPVARMSEAKYGKTMMSSIVPVFRFPHTYMDPPLLSTISFDEKKAVAFVYPASRFKLATIGALMNYARLMLIGLSASQSPRMNQLNQPQVLPYFHQPSLFRTRLVCLLLLILFFTHGGV